jgi:alpha-glucosidase
MKTGSQGVLVQGTLDCGGERAALGYILELVEVGQGQLGFTLSLADPQFNRAFLTYASNAEEHFFGFGEQFTYFDLKGQRVPLFTSEQGIGRGGQPITTGANLQAGAGGNWATTYIPMPFYITNQMRALMLETTEYAVFDLRQNKRVQVQVWANELRGRILAGNTPAELIYAYSEYAGRMRPLPDWMLGGAVIGMQGGTERVRQVWAQLKEAGTPIAAFWLQDWVGHRLTSFGKQLWWNWVLDDERYPGWAELTADLRAEGVRVMVYASPFLADASQKPGVNRNLFQEAAAAGYLVQNAAGEPYLVQNTDFSAGMVDLTNPEAVAWFQGVLEENLVGIGASGWMADFGEGLPYDAVLFDGRRGAEYHNQYPVDWARLNREVADQFSGEEIVFFTRAGYTQSQKYSALFWEGDQMVSWDAQDGLQSAVTGLLSGGISGLAFNHSDIGGYTTITNPLMNYHRSQELLMRWMELAAFTTVYRTHEGNRPEDNAQFYSNAETLGQFTRLAKVYQAWEFYRRELVNEAAQTGLPVARAMFIQYPEDPRFWENDCRQFMVGSELLAAPVLDKGAKTVKVKLPAGRWVHVWTGEVYDGGGTVEVAAPMGSPAVFYLEGSAVGEAFVENLRAAGLMP